MHDENNSMCSFGPVPLQSGFHVPWSLFLETWCPTNDEVETSVPELTLCAVQYMDVWACVCVYTTNKMRFEAVNWWLKSKRQNRTDFVVSQSRPDVYDWSRHPLCSGFTLQFTMDSWLICRKKHLTALSLRRAASMFVCVCVYLWENAHCCLWFLVTG